MTDEGGDEAADQPRDDGPARRQDPTREPELNTGVVALSIGGVSGPVLVIVVVHGVVDEDGDGQVEVCAPISPGDAQREHLSTVATRIEPAHRETYTRITKAQVAFPQILAAYRAVKGWIAEQGKRVTGSPREIYVDDVMHAAPDEEPVDIAFPTSGSPAPVRRRHRGLAS